MHNMLHEALDQAMKNRLVPENASNACVLPKQQKKEISILSRAEQKRLLTCLGSERMGFAVLLDLSTGMRIGELCCLRWTDIDMDRRLILVRRTLQRVKASLIDRVKDPDYRTKILEGNVKTDKGFRDIPIQDKVFTKLMEYKRMQDAEKELAGFAYTDNGYVFASQLGRAIEPATMRDMFNRLLAEAKLSHYTFHALRHTFATRAIENGVSIKAVSDILGHSTVQLTMDLYCHASVELKREAVNMMADLW
jgi:integrase